ncbi:MAG: hypothetical protein R3F59_27155, partial [Myxococcota bacterium]
REETALWWWTVTCRAALGQTADDLDAAFAERDTDAVSAVAERTWWPVSRCIDGAASVLRDALDDLRALDQRHDRLQSALRLRR